MDSVGGDVESGEKVDREPRMHIMADLSNEKFSLHISQYNVELYGLPCFLVRREASLLYTTVAMKPMPPAAEKNNGEKEPCSISCTRSSYALFFSSSFLR